MASFTIYSGTNNPIKAIGIHQVNILQFAHEFQCLHYFDVKDKNRLNAINALEKKGCLTVDRINNTFIFKYPDALPTFNYIIDVYTKDVKKLVRKLNRLKNCYA